MSRSVLADNPDMTDIVLRNPMHTCTAYTHRAPSFWQGLLCPRNLTVLKVVALPTPWISPPKHVFRTENWYDNTMIALHAGSHTPWTSKAAQRLYFLTLLKRAAVDPKVSCVRILLRWAPLWNMRARYSMAYRLTKDQYVCQVWHTGLTKEQSKQLESVQWRALDMTHCQACDMVGLITLRQRRQTLRMLWSWHVHCLWCGSNSTTVFEVKQTEKCPQNFFQVLQKVDHKLHYLLPLSQKERMKQEVLWHMISLICD